MASEGEGNVQAGSAADILGDAGAGAGGGGAAGAGGGDGGTAAAAGGDGGAGAGAAGAAPPEWLTGLSGDAFKEGASHRDYAASKGWKGLDDVVASYREAEHTLRSGNRVAIPGEGASADEVKAFHKAIGVPEDAAGYAFDAPTGADGQPIPLNTALLDRLSAKALASGMPAGAYKAVVADFVQAQIEEASGIETERRAEAAAWVKEQGASGQEALSSIDRAARALGLSRDNLIGMRNVLGAKTSMDMLSRIGRGMREDTLSGEGQTTFGLSGKEAQAQLNEIKNDPVRAKNAQIPGHADNVAWKRLTKMIGDAANAQASAA